MTFENNGITSKHIYISLLNIWKSNTTSCLKKPGWSWFQVELNHISELFWTHFNRRIVIRLTSNMTQTYQTQTRNSKPVSMYSWMQWPYQPLFPCKMEPILLFLRHNLMSNQPRIHRLQNRNGPGSERLRNTCIRNVMKIWSSNVKTYLN